MPLEPPDFAYLDRRLRDLRDRAALVHRDGWEPYESIWSTGEVLAVRAVLGETDAIDAAVVTWAPTLWGTAEAESDAAADYEQTRRWFAAVAPRITAAVPVAGRACTRITCSDGSSTQVPTDPVSTTGELAAILALLPSGTPVRLDDEFDGRVDRVDVVQVHPINTDTGQWGEPQWALFLCSSGEIGEDDQ